MIRSELIQKIADGGVYKPEGFVEGDGQPRPNVAAYAQMSWILDGATSSDPNRLG